MPKIYEKEKGLPSSKLSPALRMFANGDFTVNQIRAELKGNIAVQESEKLPDEVCRKSDYIPVRLETVNDKFRKGRLKDEEQPDKIMTNVFIELSSEETTCKYDEVEKIVQSTTTKKRGNVIIAEVPLTEVSKIAADPHILSVQSSQSLTPPRPLIVQSSAQAPAKGARVQALTEKNDGGANVLIGIIDVGGFDFAHPDFLDGHGHTRFQRIWDMGGSARPSPKGYNFGAEFTKAQLDMAIKSAPQILVPAHLIERQSQMQTGSHGTHVASIAAGNSGLCPKADIAGVLIALGDADFDRRKSFFDSSRLVLAVDYLVQVAKELGKAAVSINISLGTNGHAHDGSAAVNRWIDSLLTQPGRCLSIAAGNAGQESPLDANDSGFILGRIHTSGQIESTGLTKDIEWIVVGNALADVSENELEIWYSPQDRFSISIKPPGMDWIGPVRPGEFIENQQLIDGSFFSIYNELYFPANGSNYIGVYLSPNLKNRDAVVGIPAGSWKIRLYGEAIRDGRYHAWIERDDPRPLGRTGEKEIWNFPSFFSNNSNVDNSSVNSLACGQNLISVGNYDPAREQINNSSSQGPTRDGRFKPEIIAPGTDIVAAKGFSDETDLWISMTGTSMASPYVCGLAGLMLSVEPALTSTQISGIMMRTSQPIPGANYQWKDDAGYGVINPNECLRAAKTIFERKDITTKQLQG